MLALPDEASMAVTEQQSILSSGKAKIRHTANTKNSTAVTALIALAQESEISQQSHKSEGGNIHP